MNELSINFYGIAESSYREMDIMLDKDFFSVASIDSCQKETIRNSLYFIVQGDLQSLVIHDPAARRGNTKTPTTLDFQYVQDSYYTFKAIRNYRIANFMWYYTESEIAKKENTPQALQALETILRTNARRLSEEAKAQTGVEIHPAAQIGENFVIDHGYGTVIGETCHIGNDCYILQGVILGARGIKDNPSSERHPILEDDVKVGGFARLFDRITIGKGCNISPYAIITRPLPPESDVIIVNQLQITRPSPTPLKIYGARPIKNGLEIFGKNLKCCLESKLISNNHFINDVYIENLISPDSIILHFSNLKWLIQQPDVMDFELCFITAKADVILHNSLAWKDFIDSLKQQI